MPMFQYRGRNQRGEVVTGQVDGATADAVASQLFNSGVVPVDIKESKSGAQDLNIAFRSWLGSDKVGLVDLAIFSRQLYTLLKAGVPIMQALRGLRDSTQSQALAKVVNDLVDSLDSGLEFSAALKRHPKVFPTLYVSMVQVGEATGSLDEVLLQMASYLDHEKATRDRVKEATRYPMIVLIFMVLGVFFISLYVIPAFAKLYAGFRIELPWATRVIIGLSDFVVNYKYYIVILGLLATIGVRMYLQTPEGRYQWAKRKLRLPVLGRIIYQSTLERFTRSLSIMLRTGVPLVQGMTIVSRAVDNDYIGERVLQMRDGIERGETIARTAIATGLFPPLVIQMITVGEEAGALDELMTNVAGYYEREVDYDIKNLSTAIQPILITVLGAMVLVLALGVFLPMWDMVQIARQ
jgi:MSHA biogenesis protein MshG